MLLDTQTGGGHLRGVKLEIKKDIMNDGHDLASHLLQASSTDIGMQRLVKGSWQTQVLTQPMLASRIGKGKMQPEELVVRISIESRQ